MPTARDLSARAELARYLAVGAVSFVIDEGVLVGLTEVAAVNVAVAATVAFGCGLAVNFTGQRRFTFPGGERPVGGQFARYLVLVAFNLAVTVAIVTGLAAAGVAPGLAKVGAVVLLTGVNLVAYRRWVYAVPARADVTDPPECRASTH